jgi:hypothetical protein
MSGETKQRISELEAEIARLKAAQPTLRDQFAMAAFPVAYNHLESPKDIGRLDYDIIADLAYAFADEMMMVRDVED